MNWEELLPKFLDYLLYEKEASPYKVNDYRKKFTSFSHSLPLPLTLQSVRGLVLDSRKNKLSVAYINYLLTAINCFITWCQLEKLPQENITVEINKIRPREDRTPDAKDLLSVNELELIMQNPTNRPIQNKNLVCYFKKIDTMYTLLFAFCFKTACRSGEALNLRKKDFNFATHTVTFYETKTGENRTIAIPPDMDESLRHYVAMLSDTQYLFVRNTNEKENKPVTQEMANRAFKYRCKLQGIERSVHIHMLRHSGITHLLLNGCPMPIVQAIAGHKRLATTQLYTHIIVDNQREAMLKYNPLIRKSLDATVILKRIKDAIADMKLDEIGVVQYQLVEEKGSISFSIRSR